jgi:hypothetical protein
MRYARFYRSVIWGVVFTLAIFGIARAASLSEGWNKAKVGFYVPDGSKDSLRPDSPRGRNSKHQWKQSIAFGFEREHRGLLG